MQQVLDDIDAISKSTDSWANSEINEKYEDTFLKTANAFSAAEKARIDELLFACIRCGDSEIVENIATKLLGSKKFIDLKKRPDIADQVISLVVEYASKTDGVRRQYNGFFSKLIDVLCTEELIGLYCEKLFGLIKASFGNLEDPFSQLDIFALICIAKHPWQERPEHVAQMVKLILRTVQQDPDLGDDSWAYRKCVLAMSLMFRAAGMSLITYNGQGDQNGSVPMPIHLTVLSDIAEMFNFCAIQEWECSEDRTNISYAMLTAILEDFLNGGLTKPDVVKPMMNAIKKLWQSCDEPNLKRDANAIISAMAGETELMGDQTENLLNQFLKNKDMNIAMKLESMYDEQPQQIIPFLPKFLKLLSEEDDFVHMQLIALFTKIDKTAPEHITTEMIRVISRKLSSSGSYGVLYQTHALMFLDALALHRAADVLPYEENIIKSYKSDEALALVAGNLLVKLADTEARQRKYLKIFADRQAPMGPNVYKIGIISNMRQVGLSCPEILSEYKNMIKKLSATPALEQVCQSTLDVMDKRTLEGVTQEIGSQRKDINQLDTRMGATEGDVNNIKTGVKENKQNIAAVKTDVANQGQKLDDLKVVVDETVEKVVEIDHKTLSHAPAWSRDITILLNPTADHDWRLLASRLGYTPEDIRNWGTQPDPCLSMLDEWFATHKTREATYGVLKTLVEMDRIDAAAIVEKALKAVEHLVEEDDPEPAEPPPIFLSYQWAHQPEVKLLRRHLESAGYSSWMDVGQMGGGDKLFAKIDKGIRAAKVIICCVTEKYAESPNCNREVNLAVALGKPIIPLLVEKMSWPPPGAMGPIFGEYIFVRFFQRDDEKTSDDRYWAPDKFSELLMQIRYSIPPVITSIPADSMYKNWWQPPPDVIVIKSKNKASTGLPPVETRDETAKKDSPQLFISYQWDKQPEIKALYRRLTDLGFTCWLDIMQMGGGDSLFDKIDRGVRGCKLVLSCVTPKYSKSVNCRREVSLADALKKPIIPLLLEDMSWPPEGPMGMILTQLLYINFYKLTNAQIQKDWTGPEFDELLRKIKGYLQG